MIDIEKLEWWLSNADTGSEMIWHQLEDNSRDLNRLANRDAGFARLWETLKKAEPNIYLEVDNMGRCLATKIRSPSRTSPSVPEPVTNENSTLTVAQPQNGALDQRTYEILLGIIQKQGAPAFDKKCGELGIDPKLALEVVNHQALKEVRARSGRG